MPSGPTGFRDGGHASGVAPETRQGILAAVTARGEFPEAAQEAPAVQGSFDFAQDDRANSQLVRGPTGTRAFATVRRVILSRSAAAIAVVQKRQTSAAESRIPLGCLTARVELVPFPSPFRPTTPACCCSAAKFPASALAGGPGL
jgi:hypothetical protein